MIRTTFRLLKKIVVLALILFLLAVAIRQVQLMAVVETPANTLPTTPIIDMHVHIAGLGYGDSGCFISADMTESYKFDYYLNAFGVSRQDLEANGDQWLIQRLAKTVDEAKYVNGVVVLAMDGVIDENGDLDKEKTQVYIPNNYIAEQTALYSSLYFGASINPYRHDAIERLEQVKQQGAKLIKWVPSIQHIDPADKNLIPFYNKLKELNLPLLSHTGQERSFHTAINEYADPRRLELPLSLGVTVIAAHVATTGETNGQSNYQRILTMFADYPTLYTDISSLTQVNKLGYLGKVLAEPRLKDRVIYGSDYPLINMVLVSPYYYPFSLSIKQMNSIAAISNPFDRDIALKQALGVPAEFFGRSAELLDIQQQ